MTAAGIHHPNVVTVYDMGETDGHVYLVMELVEGPTLEDVLADHGQLEPVIAAAIGHQAAQALGAAHDRGMIHRDVKPANILLTSDGEVKVADFGIAKAFDDPHTTLTRTGTVMGTAAYLAPEQLTEEPVDARADIYALGLVLLECLSGEPVFSGGSTVEIALARLNHDPQRARDLRDGVPPALDEAIARATARDPSERWTAGGEFATALAPIAPRDADRLLEALVKGQGQPSVTAAHATAATAPMDPISPEPDVEHGDRPQRWRTPAIIAAIALVGLGLIYLVTQADVGRPDPPPEAVEVTNSGDHDPFGDGEHPDRVPNAHDGDRETTWTSQRYSSADFGGLKPGAGFWLDVGEAMTIKAIEIIIATPGVSLEIYAMNDPPTGDMEAWGGPVASITDAAPEVDLEIDDVEARFWLVWLTSLPADGDRHRAEIADVRLLR